MAYITKIIPPLNYHGHAGTPPGLHTDLVRFRVLPLMEVYLYNAPVISFGDVENLPRRAAMLKHYRNHWPAFASPSMDIHTTTRLSGIFKGYSVDLGEPALDDCAGTYLVYILNTPIVYPTLKSPGPFTDGLPLTSWCVKETSVLLID